MPIHDLGYRAWQGRRGAEVLRWSVIAMTGMRIAWKSNWLRRMLVLSWLPAAYMGIAFFAFEQFAKEENAGFRGRAMQRFLNSVPDGNTLAQELDLSSDLGSQRGVVWRWLLMTFFRAPQGVLLVVLVGMIAPPLISRDVRAKAFLLYFSRPLSRGEYILGKMAVVWAYVLLISTAPALVLYVLGVLLSPDLSVIGDTWDIPLRILISSIVLIVPTTTLALMLSSTTSESRYAGFAWFAIWAMGFAAWTVINLNTSLKAKSELSAVSLYHSLGIVQRWVFGLQNNMSEFYTATAVLTGITVLSLLILVRRVSAPMRV